MNSPPAAVLDASALLAFLRREEGADRVEEALRRRAAIGIVNWAEVLSKVSEVGEDPEKVVEELREREILGRNLVVCPMSEEQALDVARLRPLTRGAGLSLGDRACLALGRALGLPVLTSDGSWRSLALGVRVEAIR